MASTFPNLVREVISEQLAAFDDGTGLFANRDHMTGTLGLVQGMTSGNIGGIPSAAPNKILDVKNSIEGQNIVVETRDNRGAATGNTRVQTGTGGRNLNEQLWQSTGIVQMGFDMSTVNNVRRLATTEKVENLSARAESNIRDEIAANFASIYKGILLKLNADAIGEIDNEKWALNTTADEGTEYSTYVAGQDAKQIPNTDFESFLRKLHQDAMQNKFGPKPILLTDLGIASLIQFISAQGPGNGQNLASELDLFDHMYDGNITAGVAGYRSALYLIKPGSIAQTTRTFPWPDGKEAGEFTYGGRILDTSSPEVAAIANSEQLIDLEMIMRSSVQDTSATYTIDPANIDCIENFSFVTEGMMRIDKDPDNPNTSPIIKALLANA